MQLQGLKPLYISMKQQNIDRCRFTFSFRGTVFDVLFFIDESPYKLLFGAKGTRFSFTLAVEGGFTIQAFLDNEILSKLCKVLGLQYDPNNPFSTKYFFEEFNNRIPGKISKKDIPAPYEIAPYVNIKEDAEKVYFRNWRFHDGIKSNVRPENLEKTKLLLGNKIYINCKKKNVSSCWTDDPALDNKDIEDFNKIYE
ncbi:DUF6037 family protein [Priestia megaterium]|uniref:DUF6037 family protein n=1 Tax=Priestia megaterium TaxID=1404 RepID=UPI00234EBE1D|nr:DUF6037 family protein [Priestia megaterium]MDC7783923.1 DUF6037 family protein [Priestia megaterium]